MVGRPTMRADVVIFALMHGSVTFTALEVKACIFVAPPGPTPLRAARSCAGSTLGCIGR